MEHRVRLLQSWVLGSELTWLSSCDGSGNAQSLPVYTSTSKPTRPYIHMSYLSSLDMLDTLLLLNCLTATQIEHLISSLNWVNSHLQCFLYFILCQVVPAFPSVFPLNSLFFLYYTRALKTTVLHLINLFADLWWGWSVVCWLVVGMERMRQSLCVYDSSVEVTLSTMCVPEARLTYWPTCTRSPFVFSSWLRHI